MKNREEVLVEIRESAKKYQYRSQFREHENNRYKRASELGILDDVCSHMVRKKVHHPKTKDYSKKAFLELVSKCETRVQFHYLDIKFYMFALKKGWLDEYFGEVVGEWTFDKCLGIAKSCKTIKEFYTKHNNVYQICAKNKWLTTITKGLKRTSTNNGGNGRKPYGYWLKYENCLKAAQDCSTFSEFKIKYISAYLNSKKNGWYDEITAHIEPQRYPKDYFTKEECVEMLSKYSTRKEVNLKNPKLYNYILWMRYNDIFPKTERRKWSKEKCHEKALLCSTRMEFNTRFKNAYMVSRENGWLDDVCSHMKRKKTHNNVRSYENCKMMASKYKTRGEFRLNAKPYYLKSLSAFWIDEFFPKNNLDNGNKKC